MAELILERELAYYRQTECLEYTGQELIAWQLGTLDGMQLFSKGLPVADWSTSFKRYLLERCGHSLHRYIAQHLEPTAWGWWCAQGGVLTLKEVENRMTRRRTRARLAVPPDLT